MSKAMRPELDICVCNPVTTKYTTFEIAIQTSQPEFNLKSSRSRRRYNDFCWLRKTLKCNHPLCKPPVLPPKKQSSERFEQQFLVRRMKDLEEWLYMVVSTSLYLSDTVLHLFLQSSLSCEQITKYIKGELSEAEVEKGYKSCEVITTDTHSVFKKSEENCDRASVIGVDEMHSNKSGDTDSGIPASFVESSDSQQDENDSSYESQNSSRGSPDFVADGYPAVTEVYCSKTKDQSVKNCDKNYVTSQGNGEHVTWEDDKSWSLASNSCEGAVGGSRLGRNSEEIDSGVEKSLGDSSERSKNKKSKNDSHRVQMGVIFSVNSE